MRLIIELDDVTGLRELPSILDALAAWRSHIRSALVQPADILETE